MNDHPTIHVAVGVIYNAQGQVLIAKRPDHLHQGGLWEFPGGKVQSGEYVIDALRRELQEELGITPTITRPLIQIHHDYGDKQVWLDVHEVMQFTGQPHGREGQTIRWVQRHELSELPFPAANLPIVTSVQLPEYYAITGAFDGEQDCLSRTEQVLKSGVKLLQLRAKQVSNQDYLTLANKMVSLCEKYSAKLIVNTSVELFQQTTAHGLHLTWARLKSCSQRPINNDKFLFASVHNDEELNQAKAIHVDAMVVAPIKPTATHPTVAVLGWEKFERISRLANCPVYALGGMQKKDFSTVRAYGGQGVAAIRAFWSE